MACGKLFKSVRAVIASMMIVLLVASPVAASVAPVLKGAAASVPGEDPGSETFSEKAHALALVQLGFRPAQDACAAGSMAGQRDTSGTVWFIGGCLFTGFALAGAYLIEPSPPTSALVGQDPEYVAGFTDCYRETAMGIRQKQALYGCLAGCLVGGLGYAILIAAAASSDSGVYY